MAVSRRTWAVKGHWTNRNKQQAHGRRNGYRSGLEDTNADFLKQLGVNVQFETLKVKYEVPSKSHTYTPDFLLPNGIIVETKGLFESSDRAKHVLIKLQYPDLDIRFVFSRARDKIYKGSPTSYGEWATRNGFQWAEKTIPTHWLQEAGPSRKPEEVLADGPRPMEG